MPSWFKPLVNKVIKEGDDVTKKFATAEREIVHKTKLPDSQTDVVVTQNLDSGDVVVDIGLTKHGFRDGHLGQPVRLEYKASEEIEPILAKHMDPKDPKGFWKPHKDQKTKEEFWVEEAEFTGGHPENIKFEESTFEKFGQHGSNFDEVEKFATGKIKKIKPTKKKVQTEFESGKAEADADRWADDLDMASGGRVPLKKGKVPKLQLLDIDWDDMDPDEWVGILRSLGVKGHASGGRVPLDEGGITSRVPYFKGGSWKAIKEAIKHNKIFGLGGPPYKPGATSFDIKKLTKDRFGTELSLQELKEMGIKEGSFSKFTTGFKEYKADVIKEQLLNSKHEAKIRIKVSKDMLKKNPEDAMTKKISSQMIRDSEKRLKDLDAALKDIDVYKAMKEKTGITSHAQGGRVSLSAGGLAGMLGE